MERLALLAETFGRSLASPARARTMLGLDSAPVAPAALSCAIALDEAEEAIAG